LSSGGPKLTRKASYTILEGEEISKKQTALISYLSGQLFLSPTIARGFLMLKSWNIDKIINPYYDDPKKMLRNTFNLDLDEAEKRVLELKNSG
jgi:hypothetical protein